MATGKELPPITDLDAAFTLPETLVPDPRMRALYDVIVARLRKESSHIQMGTIQLLLIERIAFNYIVLKSKEGHPIGDPQGFAHATVQKDWNTFWMAMTTQFNNLLAKSKSADRSAIMSEVREIIVTTLDKVSDRRVKQEMLAHFAEAFDENDIL